MPVINASYPWFGQFLNLPYNLSMNTVSGFVFDFIGAATRCSGSKALDGDLPDGRPDQAVKRQGAEVGTSTGPTRAEFGGAGGRGQFLVGQVGRQGAGQAAGLDDSLRLGYTRGTGGQAAWH
jgi:hypothetical protein